MRTAARLQRAGVAAIAGLLVLTTLTVFAAPSGAYTGHALPGVSLESGSKTNPSPAQGAYAEVRAGTPLFNVELVFPINAPGLDCSVPANRNAEFKYKLSSHDGPGALLTPSVKKLCTTGTEGILTEVRVLQKVFGFQPLQQVNLLAEIQKPGTDLLPVSHPDPAQSQTSLNEDEHWLGRMQMPAQPVWVGLGDGYTAATLQALDCEFQEDPTACAARADLPSLDLAEVSWVQMAVDNVNAFFGDDADWLIQPRVFADFDDSGASLLDEGPGSQVADLVAELESVKADGMRPSSWNWIGVTAGLRDGGVMDALNAWYPTHLPDPDDPAVNNPWAIGGASCPNFSNVRATVTGPAKHGLQDGLLNVLDAALAVDPTIRVVHPLYPNFVDSASACRSAVVDAVAAINETVAKDALTARLAAVSGNFPNLTPASFDLVFDLSMHESFLDPHPTGLPVGGGDDVPSMIQLTKPYGFPHPSVDGSQAMGQAILDEIFGQQDPTPPVVTYSIALVNPADGSGAGFFRGPVRVTFNVTDPADPFATFNVAPVILTADGRHTGISSPAPEDEDAICSDVSGLCAEAVSVPDIWIDATAPTVKAFNAATGAPLIPGAWYKDTIQVRWLLDHDETGANLVSGINPATDNALSTTAATSGVVTLPVGTVGKLCDRAGNCAQPTAEIKIDRIAPTISSALAVAPGGSSVTVAGATWYRGTSVRVTWSNLQDTGGSGLAPGFTVTPPPVDVLNEGVTTVVPFTPSGFCDVAGNCTTYSTTVRLDNTGPTISFGPNAPTDPLAVLPAMPVLQCLLSDAGVGVASSTCTLPTVTGVLQPNGTRKYTITVTATDRLGNPTTKTLVFLLAANADAPPDTTILGGPVGPTGGPDEWTQSPFAVFGLTGNDDITPTSALTYRCKLDGTTVPCSSLGAVLLVTPGTHVFTAAAVDAAGNVDPTPAEYRWGVDFVDPTVNVPGPQLVATAPGATTATVNYTTSASDAHSGLVSPLACSPASGSAFPIGQTTVTCTATDKAGNTTTKTFVVTVGGTLGGGQSFVIGDLSDNVGSVGYYWGSQWWKEANNRLSRTPKPPSFKGWANRMGTDGRWYSDPGNSSGPPSSVPAYLVVIVSSDVKKSGSTISGDIVNRVIIKTEAGYGPAPGHVGKGLIVGVVQ